ncbi:MAG: hypothetical protein HIU92_17395 [Proteobacteria bacterium]|nr:hypothetical protein [Pseudomonadota bacterium]
MKERLIERLDLLAEIGEAAWLQEIARQSRSLAQAEEQRALLRAYREKLGQSWRGGNVVDAAAAKRAAEFIAASHHAEAQIDRMERHATQQIDLARRGFADAQERRRGLAVAKREAVLATDRATEQRLERAQPQAVPKLRKPP